MGYLKTFLTSENILLFGFNISNFALTFLLILVIFCIILKIKKLSITKNLIKCTFITLSIITFLFAFLNVLSGEFLFSQKENIKLYMLIAVVALWVYIIDASKELFTKNQ